MQFIDRLARLVKSDAHSILDQLEERSLLLKQHLRDAELALNQKRDQADALAEEQRRLREEEQRLDARVAALDEDVELALAGEKEELARFAVRRLIPVRETSRDVKARIARAAVRHERISECISEGASGLLTTEELWMDTQRADYVFRGLEKLDAVDRVGKRLGAVLLSGGTQPIDTGYLGSYSLRASDDASGTFSVTISAKETSMVASKSNQIILFSEGPPAEITVGAQQLRRLPAERR